MERPSSATFSESVVGHTACFASKNIERKEASHMVYSGSGNSAPDDERGTTVSFSVMAGLSGVGLMAWFV